MLHFFYPWEWSSVKKIVVNGGTSRGFRVNDLASYLTRYRISALIYRWSSRYSRGRFGEFGVGKRDWRTRGERLVRASMPFASQASAVVAAAAVVRCPTVPVWRASRVSGASFSRASSLRAIVSAPFASVCRATRSESLSAFAPFSRRRNSFRASKRYDRTRRAFSGASTSRETRIAHAAAHSPLSLPSLFYFLPRLFLSRESRVHPSILFSPSGSPSPAHPRLCASLAPSFHVLPPPPQACARARSLARPLAAFPSRSASYSASSASVLSRGLATPALDFSFRAKPSTKRKGEKRSTNPLVVSTLTRLWRMRRKNGGATMMVQTDVEGRRGSRCYLSCALSLLDPWQSPSTVSVLCAPVFPVSARMCIRARACIQMSFTYLRTYAPRRARARAPFDNLLRITEDSFRGGRGRRERDDVSGARTRKRNGAIGERASKRKQPRRLNHLAPFFFFQNNRRRKSNTETASLTLEKGEAKREVHIIKNCRRCWGRQVKSEKGRKRQETGEKERKREREGGATRERKRKKSGRLSGTHVWVLDLFWCRSLHDPGDALRPHPRLHPTPLAPMQRDRERVALVVGIRSRLSRSFALTAKDDGAIVYVYVH